MGRKRQNKQVLHVTLWGNEYLQKTLKRMPAKSSKQTTTKKAPKAPVHIIYMCVFQVTGTKNP